MEKLPDLKRLSDEEKDALIIRLWAVVQEQGRQIERLVARVKELEGKLSLNSRNSSKPPSSDGLNKPKPKSLRPVGQRPCGGQKGHPGITLRQVEEPDEVIVHEVPRVCEVCQRKLNPKLREISRQVFDLPEPRLKVTEHRVEEAVCSCGKEYMAEFTSDVTNTVQYGAVAQAMMVYLSHQHMLPAKRTAQLMGEMLGQPVCSATVQQACAKAAQRLTTTVKAIAQAVQNSAVVHADETGLRVNKKLHWMHVAVTGNLTWMAMHTQRGASAFEDLGVLPQFKGTLVQ